MSTLEERISFQEAKMEDVSRSIADVRDLIVRLEEKMVRLEEKMERRFDQIDRRFMWVIGVQFTTLFTIIAVLLRR